MCKISSTRLWNSLPNCIRFLWNCSEHAIWKLLIVARDSLAASFYRVSPWLVALFLDTSVWICQCDNSLIKISRTMFYVCLSMLWLVWLCHAPKSKLVCDLYTLVC